jgi:hypothetical protein
LKGRQGSAFTRGVNAQSGLTAVVRFQHLHAIAAGTIANVGIKGPPEDIDYSGALDLTFASRDRGWQHSERQIRSTIIAMRRKPVLDKIGRHCETIEISKIEGGTDDHRAS